MSRLKPGNVFSLGFIRGTIFLCLVILCLTISNLCTGATAQEQQPTNSIADSTQLSLDVRRKTFDLVWETVRASYYDASFKGVNWDGVRAIYLPEVERVADSDGFHALLNNMVKELKESHLSVIPPPKAKNAGGVSAQANIGIELELIEGQIIVTQVERDSPASKAGIQIGERLVSVDDTTVERIYQQFLKVQTIDSAELRATQRALSVMRKLLGAPGTKVKLKLYDRKNRVRQVILERMPSATHGAVKPATFRKIKPSVGYLQIPIWAGKLDKQLDEVFQDCAGCQTLIIDLRGNIGGVGALALGLAKRLMSHDGSLGELRYRDRKESYKFPGAGDQAFKGKVIVLIDAKSASSSELFAAGLQDAGRAAVIGTRSAGAVLLSLIKPLPTGGSMLYPIADVFTPKGTRLEGRGVIPDIEVKMRRQALTEGRDLVLEAAIALASKS